MKRAAIIPVVWLFILFSSCFAVALAAGSLSLGGTTWTGKSITLVTTAGTITNKETLSIFFMGNRAKPDLLYGTLTFTPSGFTRVPFTAIRHANSLSIVAHAKGTGYTGASYLIEADIVQSHRGAASATMRIRGKSLSDGSQFEGILTE